MTIRPATIADAPRLQALAHSIWNAVYPPIISQAQIDCMLERMYNPAQIASEIHAGYAWEWVEENEKAIGFLSTLVENGNALKVSKIYLEPTRHGKGIGQQILAHIDAKAKAARVESIYLFVNRNNTRAIRAYLRAGYEIVQTLDQDFHGFALNDYRLQKKV